MSEDKFYELLAENLSEAEGIAVSNILNHPLHVNDYFIPLQAGKYQQVYDYIMSIKDKLASPESTKITDRNQLFAKQARHLTATEFALLDSNFYFNPAHVYDYYFPYHVGNYEECFDFTVKNRHLLTLEYTPEHLREAALRKLETKKRSHEFFKNIPCGKTIEGTREERKAAKKAAKKAEKKAFRASLKKQPPRQ